MAFQDFDQISERRKAEKARKVKKRIIIAVVVILLLVLIAVGAYFIVNRLNNKKGNAKQGKVGKPAPMAPKQKNAPSKNKTPSNSKKILKEMCSVTDYKDKCEGIIEKANGETKPMAFIKTAISATSDEAKSVYSKTAELTFNSPEEKGAFEDCKELFEDAMEELGDAISQVGSNTESGKVRIGVLNSWLSAVISYQQTCIDGFPDGKLKSDLEKMLQTSKEFTSNSLAMLSLLNQLQLPGTGAAAGSNRRLLSQDKGEFPTWMSHEDRRMLKKNDKKLTPNVTVAKDGSGNYKTINEALEKMPQKYEGRYVIYVKEGVYDETVTVTKKMPNVTMYGDGSQKSIITGNKNFADGVRTFQTAPFAALGEGFMAKSMGFRNTAGPEKRQAVAARVQADRAIFLNCRFEGYQETLYVQTHRQFYKSCVISGTVDFIFGDAATIFQNCLIYVRKPLENQQNTVTAQGRTDKRETTGIVLQNCQIMPDKDLEPVKSQFKTYLGRPWKEFSRTIVMESTIEDLIHPDGWTPWEGDFALKTLYYAEYNNKGPGAKTDNRVKWDGYKKINKEEAMQYTVGPFLKGHAWLKVEGVPVRFGLFEN
ncbi:putative pectinesterase/pectinesterase inhibitor 45 [Pyrus x bretschneideri]|uniref:putative pectinesterase/pectinesterase inhibitor 45 n=1 Tax=Pyrus x bretschneideri TaxID=225117 RepID=UPI000510AF73|nr:putative pectinesterase/pectinesterase inhibitor 45 [Pyrus x bretschneideri]